MKIEDLRGKCVLILGYGKEGKATEAWLKRFVPDAKILIADQIIGKNYLEAQDHADIVIKTPGIPRRWLHVPYTTASNIFFANVTCPVIGVTGSKGKSTTASLIAAIMQAAGKHVYLVGNIGRPALGTLLEPIESDAWFVMELSSYQLEDAMFSPHISVITNIFPEHLPYHGGFFAYQKAKFRILDRATPSDYFIYNPRCEALARLAEKTHAQAVPFISSISFSLDHVALQGLHNEENIRAALTVVDLLSIPQEVSRQVIEAFVPLPHRLQFVGSFRDVDFYDDAIATAPEPTMFAIETLKRVETIFLGGEDRGFDYAELAQVMASRMVRNVVLFPDTQDRIESALRLAYHDRELNLLHTKSMEEAVAFAFANTSPGKICLLSTAAPSYSLWKNFEEKGEAFVCSIYAFTSTPSAS